MTNLEDGKVIDDFFKVYVYSPNGNDILNIFEVKVKDVPSLITELKKV